MRPQERRSPARAALFRGRSLKALREAAGASPADVAARLGVSLALVYDLEEGYGTRRFASRCERTLLELLSDGKNRAKLMPRLELTGYDRDFLACLSTALLNYATPWPKPVLERVAFRLREISGRPEEPPLVSLLAQAQERITGG